MKLVCGDEVRAKHHHRPHKYGHGDFAQAVISQRERPGCVRDHDKYPTQANPQQQ